MCESNTAALCKSNGQGTIETFRGTAWQVIGMGTAWERHGMCELAFRDLQLLSQYEKGKTVCVRATLQPKVKNTKTSITI
jgi:hypothetical protein